MGYIRHIAILVTSPFAVDAEEAHRKAVELCGPLVTPLGAPVVNRYQSFAVLPDGSKLGWAEAEMAAAARSSFIMWMRGSNLAIDWVLVQYGDDDGSTTIVAHSDEAPPA